MSVKYVADFEKSVVFHNFEKRGWLSTTLDQPWNVYWASAQGVKCLFSNSNNGYRLQDDQMVNHFPNHKELTRKDLMVKNFKRYRKELEKERHPVAIRNEKQPGTYLHLDLIPTTFMMPGDYNLFLAEFKKHPGAPWIVKPCSRARGSGIFLVRRLSHIKRWVRELRLSSLVQSIPSMRDAYLISRYIDKPLLIGGRKFDLRLYVLVTSFRPLTAFLYRRGFARFCSIRYSKSSASLENPLAHLTNVSIQKSSKELYNPSHGNKWSLAHLFLYITCCYGVEVAEQLMRDVRFCILHSLLSVASVIRSDKHCFELYGYDIIIDETMKPWLIEINASPSLTATTCHDRKLKTSLIDDLLNIIVPNNNVMTSTAVQGKQIRFIPTELLGDFEIISEDWQGKHDST